MNATTIGLDIAKTVFQVHGVDRAGKTVLRKELKRSQVLAFFANLPPAVIGLEACAGAHYWARELIKLGHDARLIAPQFVKPYVKGNKHDANDAEAICEAVGRPSMRFVPLKSPEQQDIQMLHRIRQNLVKQRTATANQTRGLLGEYGLVVAQGVHHTCAGGCRRSWRMPRTVLAPWRAGSLPIATIAWSISTGKSRLTSSRLKRSASRAPRVSNSWRSRGSDRSLPRPWSPRSATARPSTMADRWRPGWASCRGRSPAAASRGYWGSASAVIPTCVPC